MESLKELVDEVVLGWLTEEQKEILGKLKTCESPIEEKLFLALVQEFESVGNRAGSHLMSRDTCSLSIDTQSIAQCGSKQYRLDIEVIFKHKESDTVHKFAIECDGHEFHERTKEQAKADRERERNLMMYDYQVIRFTGSEIYHSVEDCVSEVMYIINRRMNLIGDLKLRFKNNSVFIER